MRQNWNLISNKLKTIMTTSIQTFSLLHLCLKEYEKKFVYSNHSFYGWLKFMGKCSSPKAEKEIRNCFLSKPHVGRYNYQLQRWQSLRMCCWWWYTRINERWFRKYVHFSTTFCIIEFFIMWTESLVLRLSLNRICYSRLNIKKVDNNITDHFS